ncbi:hypothetical protein P171DRAFT_436762 [Karstenula rhodostoma CBS 690.94]|uniref:RBR-type E3 ubiquitin transferase n=1 Tax=Karstenula rhodostoma CBS 690.94 TaxID=1392251 RepID=A0A9P4P980_9PLEO|nr:hypothetical protein P171DRAFT_436762 [Karstenula rhodostoma CBS 690.94]
MARKRSSQHAAPQPTPPTASGSAGNPISLRGSNSPAPAAPAIPAPPTGRSGLRSAKSLGTVAVGQPTTQGNRVAKAAPKKKEPKPKPIKKECFICATTRQVSNCAGRGFKAVEGACDHFQNTCNVCIGKMIKEKIVKRDLDEAVLVCAFPDCEHVLDYNTIRQMIFKGARENWDTALLNHHLSNSENYVPCLNPNCGRYFSVEDCQAKSSESRSKNKADRSHPITCPYCEEDMCLDCMRPWHRSTSCDKAKIAEEEQSLQVIKNISKPCPKCGANIQKNGGCNHMKCRHCKHDFCFSCLVGFGPNMQHAEGCPERNQNILQDPRNWLPDDVNIGNWMPAMMRAAGLPDLPQQPGQVLPPPIPPPPNPVGAPRQPEPRGLLGLLQMIRAFHHNHPEVNGNANGGQDQPGN